MTTETSVASESPGGLAAATEEVRAHHRVVKKLGPWTTARRFDVRASRSLVVLDLLLPAIEPGDIGIHLDIDHATVKLLVPDGATIVDDDLRRVGRGRVKDWTGTSALGGRRIHLLGEMRHAEIRVHRGGVAILNVMGSSRRIGDVRRAANDGRLVPRFDGAGDGRARRPPAPEGIGS
jgi:hypothetical protein